MTGLGLWNAKGDKIVKLLKVIVKWSLHSQTNIILCQTSILKAVNHSQMVNLFTNQKSITNLNKKSIVKRSIHSQNRNPLSKTEIHSQLVNPFSEHKFVLKRTIHFQSRNTFSNGQSIVKIEIHYQTANPFLKTEIHCQTVNLFSKTKSRFSSATLQS